MFLYCQDCKKMVWYEEEPKQVVCNDCKDNSLSVNPSTSGVAVART